VQCSLAGGVNDGRPDKVPREWLRQAPDHPIEAPQPPTMAGATILPLGS
jgi:hypothetical protein